MCYVRIPEATLNSEPPNLRLLLGHYTNWLNIPYGVNQVKRMHTTMTQKPQSNKRARFSHIRTSSSSCVVIGFGYQKPFTTNHEKVHTPSDIGVAAVARRQAFGGHVDFHEGLGFGAWFSTFQNLKPQPCTLNPR